MAIVLNVASQAASCMRPLTKVSICIAVAESSHSVPQAISSGSAMAS